MSSSEDDQQPEEKKLKLGEDHLKQAYEYDLSNVGRDDPDSSDDEERDMTPEEAKSYYDALENSGGFDVPELPHQVHLCGTILPMYVAESLDDLLHFSKAGIDFFNKTYGTNYKVVEVKKSMYQGARGINFYITFEAKIDDDKSSGTTKSDDDNSDTSTTDADNSGTETFEALVLWGIPKHKGDDATKVIFCREKGGRTAEAEESEDEGGSVDEEEESENEEGGSLEEVEGASEEKLESGGGEGGSVQEA